MAFSQCKFYGKIEVFQRYNNFESEDYVNVKISGGILLLLRYIMKNKDSCFIGDEADALLHIIDSYTEYSYIDKDKV